MLEDPAFRCSGCRFRGVGVAGCPLRPRTLPAGTVICRQGERPERISYLRDGTVSVCAVLADGEEQTLALRGPDSLIGLEALHGGVASCEVRTTTVTRLCAGPVPEVERWLGERTSPARPFVDALLVELHRRGVEAEASRGPALARVARFLLEGTVGGARLRNQEIARAIGLRAETLSRCLAQLRRHGLVSTTVPPKVLDRKGLEQVAARSPRALSRA